MLPRRKRASCCLSRYREPSTLLGGLELGHRGPSVQARANDSASFASPCFSDPGCHARPVLPCTPQQPSLAVDLAGQPRKLSNEQAPPDATPIPIHIADLNHSPRDAINTTSQRILLESSSDTNLKSSARRVGGSKWYAFPPSLPRIAPGPS